jgi:hypothetical protein
MCEIKRTWTYMPGATERDPRSNHPKIMKEIEECMSAGKTLGFVTYGLTTEPMPTQFGQSASGDLLYTLTIGSPEEKP